MLNRHYYLLNQTVILSITLLAVALTLIASAAAAPPIYWCPANTDLPTNVEALAASPTILYAGTWDHGVYRSTDHGASWQSANTGITLPLHIQNGLAVNPITPTQVFAGDTYGGGLYRSDNGGISWTLALVDTAIRAAAVHPITPTIVLVGDREEGLYRSADGGATWSPVGSTAGLSDPHIRALAFAPAAPDTVYAGAGASVFASANAGLTWSPAGTLSSTVEALVVHPLTPTRLYAGTFANGAFYSEDGGATWSAPDNGIPEHAWVTSLAIDPAMPTTLYAGTWDGEVYRSVDAGATWEGLGYLGYVYDVLIHPTEPSVLYAATSNNGVFRGSTLDHLGIDPVASPQYVNHTFPITLTAFDALGFPLTGATQAQLRAFHAKDARLAATLAGGYAGAATLTDAAGTLTPTAVSLVDGVATAHIVIAAPYTADVITATLADGPVATSNPFDVVYAPVAHFTFAPIADQVVGRPFTITITARDTVSLTVPYTGAVVLSDTTGAVTLTEPGPCTGSLMMRCAGPFVEGMWSGQVIIATASPAVVISAASDGVSGSSNSFAVYQRVYLPLVVRTL